MSDTPPQKQEQEPATPPPETSASNATTQQQPKKAKGGLPPQINDICTTPSAPLSYERQVHPRLAKPYNPSNAPVQADYYPHIQPLVLTLTGDASTAKVQFFNNVVLPAAKEMGWQIIYTDENQCKLQAVATTRLLRFKDDVVIQVVERNDNSSSSNNPGNNVVSVEVRSRSRLGAGDWGANSKRINQFLVLVAAKHSKQ